MRIASSSLHHLTNNTTITTTTSTSKTVLSYLRRQTIPLPHSTSPRTYSTTPTLLKMAPTAADLIALAKQRRSFYPLSKDLGAATPARVQEIVKELLDQVPSSFNSQSNRAVVLFGAEHEKLWDITTEILKAIVPEAQWEGTAGKMGMFKAAAGTVRFILFTFPIRVSLLYFLFSSCSLLALVGTCPLRHLHLIRPFAPCFLPNCTNPVHPVP